MTGTWGSARDPFAMLGLRADDELTDDDVRVAWRRVAAATHPDRADGGDPGRFALATAAYTDLRTAFGRNEARAALTGSLPVARIAAGWNAAGWNAGRRRRRRPNWQRRPARLLLRLIAAAAVAVLGGTAAGWDTPAAPALVVGALTWFLVDAGRGHDRSP